MTEQTEWFEGKNSAQWITTSSGCQYLDNKKWGFHLKNVPLAKAFRDDRIGKYISYADLLNAIQSTQSRREQLAMIAVAAFAWDGDEGYGRPPSDDDNFNGHDL